MSKGREVCPGERLALREPNGRSDTKGEAGLGNPDLTQTREGLDLRESIVAGCRDLREAKLEAGRPV